MTDPHEDSIAEHDEPVSEECAAPVLDAQSLEPSEEPSSPVGAPSRVGLTEDGRLRTGRLAGMTMGKAIWVLSWPIMTESYLNSLVGLTDTTLASQMSEAATDAIGVASYFVWFIGLITMALASGATALVSRSVGKGRLAVASAAVGQTVLLAIISGLLVGALMAMLAPYIAKLVNLKGEASDAFIDYLRIVAAGVPMSSVLFAGIACLRGAGDSTRPLHAMIACNIVNIGVSFLLSGVDFRVSSFADEGAGPVTLVPAMFDTGLGISGIAIGTVCAHTIGAVIILAMLTAGRSGVALKRSRIVPHWVTIHRLTRLGLPNFAESLGMWIGNFVIVAMVGLLGVSALSAAGDQVTSDASGLFGAHIWAIRIEAFSFLPGFSMGMAAATLAGQYLGAGSHDLARKAVLRCTIIGSGVMAMMGAAFILFPDEIIGTFTVQESHLRLVPPLLVTCGWVQIPFGLALVIRSALRGAGDVKVVMMMTWVSTYALRIPLAYAFSGVDVPIPQWLGGGVIENPFRDEPSLTGLWIGLCAELAIRGTVFLIRFMGDSWTKAKV